MKFKIQGGTPKGRKDPLCTSCAHSLVSEDDRGDIYIYCSLYGFGGEALRIERKIVRCSSYNERNKVSIHQMEKIAWILRTEKGGKQIGFKPYSKLSSEEKLRVQEETEDW